MQMQREAWQENELSNLTRQRQLLESVNYRRAIIEELEHLSGNLVACKTTKQLRRIQKAVFVEVIDLKKELRLQSCVLPKDLAVCLKSCGLPKDLAFYFTVLRFA
nr:hypothetical protein [Tanacetum cinerariifolium]